MHTGELPIRVPAASSFLPGPVGTLLRPLDQHVRRFFLPDDLVRSLSRASTIEKPAYAEVLLRDLQISFQVAQDELERIPGGGPTLLVSNHPFGFLEGLILLSVLPRIRPDFRIVVNSLLSSLEPLQEHFSGMTRRLGLRGS